MVNNRLKEHIVETVDNQLRDNEPRCVKDTFEKLISMGYKDKKAKEMIGAVLIEEMYYIMKNQQPFNEKRYSNKLAMLPSYKGENIEEESEENYEDEIVQMPVKNENKIGRNEPCPCGSGKKYKKCCGK